VGVTRNRRKVSLERNKFYGINISCGRNVWKVFLGMGGEKALG